MATRGVRRRMLNLRMSKEGSSGKVATTANRIREIRLSGMRGGLAETWAMEEIGTRRATERVRSGHSLPKVCAPYFYPTMRKFGSFKKRITGTRIKCKFRF